MVKPHRLDKDFRIKQDGGQEAEDFQIKSTLKVKKLCCRRQEIYMNGNPLLREVSKLV